MFHQNETIMKASSLQHPNTLVNNRIYASYQIDFSNLTNIYTLIMKKLTNVSPFLLLLVPVFMMMVLTMTAGPVTNHVNETALKTVPGTSVAKISNQLIK